MPSTAIAMLDAFQAHDNPVNHVAFSPTGGVIATSDTAMVTRIWRNRELAFNLDLRSISDKVRPTERIRGVLFSSDGNRLFVAAGEYVASFNLVTQSDEPDWVYVAPRLFAFLVVSPTSIALSRTDRLSAAFENGSIATWDASGHLQGMIRHNASPRTLVSLPDETLLGTDSFSTSLWQIGQKKPLWHRPSKDRIYGMAASEDGSLIALRKLFVTTVYNVADGSQVAEYPIGRGLPLVAFGSRRNTLALGTQHAITMHDIATQQSARLILDDAELVSLSFLPDGSQIIGGCSDGMIRTWDNPLYGPAPEPVS